MILAMKTSLTEANIQTILNLCLEQELMSLQEHYIMIKIKRHQNFWKNSS